MTRRYRLDHETLYGSHSELEILDENGQIRLVTDSLTSNDLTCEVSHLTSAAEPAQAEIFFAGTGTIQISDPCDDRPCVQIEVETANLRTILYLPEEVTLNDLHLAMEAAIVGYRIRTEAR